jgi:TolA-binding protein
MTDDLLKRATNALREETGEPELRSGLTRARLFDSAAQQHKQGRARFRWVVPFVLTFGASAALGQVTHQYFPVVWNAVMPDVLDRQLSEPEQPKLRKHKQPAVVVPAPVAQPVPAPAPVIEAPARPEPVVELTPVAQKPLRTKRAPATVKHETPAPAPAPVVTIKPAPQAESAELALFRRAMKLHDAKDKSAIGAWDDFLRVAPKSPLATEARYNRALGLVRANRAPEAKAALKPFARGDYGGYRKREAAELLEALDTRDAGVRAH